jgi:hypothetical protein
MTGFQSQTRGMARAGSRLQQIPSFCSTLWWCTVDGLASTFSASSNALVSGGPETDDWDEGFSVTLRHASEAADEGMCWITTGSISVR